MKSSGKIILDPVHKSLDLLKQVQQNAIKVESGEMRILDNPEPNIDVIGTHALNTKDATLEERIISNEPFARHFPERRRLNQHRRLNEALY